MLRDLRALVLRVGSNWPQGRKNWHLDENHPKMLVIGRSFGPVPLISRPGFRSSGGADAGVANSRSDSRSPFRSAPHPRLPEHVQAELSLFAWPGVPPRISRAGREMEDGES